MESDDVVEIDATVAIVVDAYLREGVRYVMAGLPLSVEDDGWFKVVGRGVIDGYGGFSVEKIYVYQTGEEPV